MRNFFIILAFFVFLITSDLLYAGPTVITDNRVVDLATTPVLGRGYSIATNTYQSTCLKNIELTEPSYDFTYLFNSIEIKGLGDGELESKIDVKSFSEAFRNELIKKLLPQRNKGKETEQQYYNHNIYVEVNLNSYYASVDESKSKISKSAARLLQSNDIPGFFSSCGSYYVRSIGRNAKFVAIFTYRTQEPVADKNFEDDLETELSGFGKGIKKKITGTVIDAAFDAADVITDRVFKKKAASKKLTINVAAFGLGKNEKATLISYDIDSFKSAIADAFLSMQNPRTGKVSTIEVVPWVENTEFQSNVKLDEDVEVVVEDPSKEEQKDGKSVKKTRKLLLYEKKQILNLNAEFLAELERMDRKMLNLYYKAKICRKFIDENWTNNGILKNEYRLKNVLNNKVGATYPLIKLDKLLTQAKIDQLLDKEKLFMYGGTGWGEGAATCMKKMMRLGIFKVPYRDIKSCIDILKKMADVENQIIENYCMPMLAK